MPTKDISNSVKSGAIVSGSAGRTVTVEPSGARSVDLGQVLKSERGRAQLEQIQKIQDSQVKRG